MTTAVMKSQLNPLAATFVPSKYTKNESLYENTTLVVNENKTEFENVKAHKRIGKSDALDMLMLKIQRLGINVELLLLKKSISKDDLFSWITSLPKVFLANRTLSKVPSLENSSESDLTEKSVCYNVHGDVEEESLNSSKCLPKPLPQADKEKCNCPAIFGWIVPPDFFGNPLKLDYNCNKRYAHISSLTEKLNCENSGKSNDLETNEFASDSCDSEEKGKNEISGSECGDSSQPELDKKLNDSVIPYRDEVFGTCEETSLIPNSDLDLETSEMDLIDDGCHPLLDSDTTKIIENDECLQSLKQTETILARSLSRDEQTAKNSPESKLVCNPPCSVWCEHCPPAAKDTFKKFLKGMGSKDSDNFILEQKLLKRPKYNRSFSLDDARLNVKAGDLFRTSSAPESNLLFGTNPLTSSKCFQSSLINNRRYSSHPDVSNSQLRPFSNTAADGSNKWGPFDGADSLWKPLPECIPSNDYNHKHVNHKRARELKRQKSLN